jgi:lipopolysaccharide heptosyltransferase I
MSQTENGKNFLSATATPPSDPKKILILLHGSIGDVTRALPLATQLRRRFPLARLAWSVEPPSLPLVEHCRSIDEVIVFDRRRWWRSLGPFLRRIRSHRFDLVLDLQRHLKSGVISRWTGAPYRLGFHRSDSKEFNWLFNNHFIPAAGEEIPKLQHYMKFAEHLGIVPQPIEWELGLSPQDALRVKHYLQEIDGDFAVLFAGARWESKQWFPSQMAACATEIQRRYRLGVVLLGSRDDEHLASEAELAAAGRVHNWVGRTSLSEAAGIISQARVCVGPDTGLMHLSAALGTPVVSLWGATNPSRTGPYGYDDFVIRGQAACSPCYRARCPIGRICMRSIDMEEVLRLVAKALTRGQPMRAAHGSLHEV